MAEEAFHILQDDEGIAFIIDGRRVPFTAQADTENGAEAEKIAPLFVFLEKIALPNPIENSSILNFSILPAR